MTGHRLALDWQSREPEISTAHWELWWDDELVTSGDTDPSNGPTDEGNAGSPKKVSSSPWRDAHSTWTSSSRVIFRYRPTARQAVILAVQRSAICPKLSATPLCLLWLLSGRSLPRPSLKSEARLSTECARSNNALGPSFTIGETHLRT